MTQNQGQSLQGLLNPRFTLNDIFFHVSNEGLVNPTEPLYIEEKKDTRKEGLDAHKEGISTQKVKYNLFM
jgi:hypothetical protein